MDDMFSEQLLPEKVLSNQIKSTQSGECFFSTTFAQKSLKINEIKKAQKVQDKCSSVKTGIGQFLHH